MTCNLATICVFYNKHIVTSGETVVALRSNGERTVATIEKVKANGILDLVVGEVEILKGQLFSDFV